MSGPDKKKLDKMIWQLREGWGESTRVEAARDLGWIGTEVAEEAVPELIKALLDDKSENVKRGNREKLFQRKQWIGPAKQGYLNYTNPMTKEKTIIKDKERFNLLQKA